LQQNSSIFSKDKSFTDSEFGILLAAAQYYLFEKNAFIRELLQNHNYFVKNYYYAELICYHIF